MATTAIWKVESRLDQVINYTTNEVKTKSDSYDNEFYKSLHNVIEYATADFKTEEQYYVSSINCLKETAFEEMTLTKKQFNKIKGILGFHAFQSFAEGEVTPEIAHEIGVRLAEEIWGDRFEVIVSTHLNTNHIHNHFVVNSVSFKDGKRYYDNNTTYALIRNTSDALCEEYGLSVIKEKKTERGKIDYEKIYQGKVCSSNYYTSTKEDIDKAIELAFSYKEFQDILKEMGYQIFFRANKISVRRNPYKRNIRIERAFGDEYSIDNIKYRIINTQSKRIPFPEEYSKRKYRFRGTKIQNKKKTSGIHKLYLYYCYLLKIYPKKYPNKYLPPSIREDIKKLDKISDEIRLLGRNHIKTTKQLFLYKQNLAEEMARLRGEKEILYEKLRRNKNSDRVKINNDIAILSDKINILKKEVMMCEEIEKRTPKIKENIQEKENLTKTTERSREEYDKFK